MKLFIKLIGLITFLSGISMLINPDLLFDWMEESLQSGIMYFIAIIGRFVMGGVFLLAAKESKYPGAIKFFGYLAIVAAIVFILMGQEGFEDFFSELLPQIRPYAVLSGFIDMAIGGFFFYSVYGDSNSADI